MISPQLFRKLEKLPEDVKDALLSLAEELVKTVTKEEFNELKQIVADLSVKVGELAQAQKRTEQRLEELAEAQRESEERLSRLEKVVEELAEAQKRTEQRVEELAEAQKRTEQRVEELAEAQKKTEEEIRKLTGELTKVKQDLGGLAMSFAYALENEAYKNLPRVLKEKYGIEVLEKFVRAEVGGEEINFLARARKNGEEVYIVGESKLRLDESAKRQKVLQQLQRKVKIVEQEYKLKALPLLVTHFATRKFLDTAEKEGVLVVQSFEW